MFHHQSATSDIEAIRSLDEEIKLNPDSLLVDLNDMAGYDIIEEAREFCHIQKQFEEAAAIVEEKAKLLGNVAEELETIEKEKENFDEWARNVKDKFEKGEDVSTTLKVNLIVV